MLAFVLTMERTALRLLRLRLAKTLCAVNCEERSDEAIYNGKHLFLRGAEGGKIVYVYAVGNTDALSLKTWQ